jgi:hypothetical protein
MTVNERLWAAELSDEFYAAVERKDVERVIEILKEVEVDDESIKMNLKFFRLD